MLGSYQDPATRRLAAGAAGVLSDERQEGWNQNHLANQKPQVKWQKLSRKHAVAKKKNRLEQKERRGRGGGGRGRGDGRY